MSRRRKALVGLGTAACCMALPAVSSAHGPPKITEGPTGTVTATSALFEFEYQEPAPGQQFQCSLDGAAFQPCEDATMPDGRQSYSDLAPGRHVFKVRRAGSPFPVDPLADETPAERAWTVAEPAPAPGPTPTPTPEPTPPPPPIDSSKPSPCDGVFQVTDAKGDWHHDNTDVLGAFFRYANGAVTANVVVVDQHERVEHEGNVAVFWRMAWNGSDGVRRWVGATGSRYEHGTVDGTAYKVAGETQGTRFAGSNGIVQIVIPGAGPGATLYQPVVLTGETKLDGSPDYGDRAPGGTSPSETATGADYVVSECGAPAESPPGPGGSTSAGVTGVVLDESSLRLRYLKVATISGRLSPGNAGVRVELTDATGKVLGTAATAEGGRFSLRLRVRERMELKVRAAGVSSATLPLEVDPLIRLRKRRVGSGLKVSGWIRPASKRAIADVEQRTGGQWIAVKTVKLRKGRFSTTLRGVRRARLRVVLQEAGR